MSNSFMIVAPSLDIVVFPEIHTIYIAHMTCEIQKWVWLLIRDHTHHSPLPSTMSLSMPRGPNVDDIASTTTSHALILLMIWGFPWEVSVPSLRRMMGAC